MSESEMIPCDCRSAVQAASEPGPGVERDIHQYFCYRTCTVSFVDYETVHLAHRGIGSWGHRRVENLHIDRTSQGARFTL